MGLDTELHISELNSSDHEGASVLVSTFARLGLRNAVISPGSRNAPLTIALAFHPEIKTHIVFDERSAAHMALGMALKTGVPAIVVSTSGTAAINHGPAIAEAFHQRTPLISITADRPSEVISKGHGQTITQTNLFDPNTLFSATIDENLIDSTTISFIALKAWSISISGGPVHLNIPFKEPLYGTSTSPKTPQIPELSQVKKSLSDTPLDYFLPKQLFNNGSRTLVIAGPMNRQIKNVSFNNIAGIAERFSGIDGPSILTSGDRIIAAITGSWPHNLKPNTIVTIGLPTMSKALRNRITDLGIPHIHVGNNGDGWNTFDSLQASINIEPTAWLSYFSKTIKQDDEFIEAWSDFKISLIDQHQKATEIAEWSDLVAHQEIFNTIPNNSIVHFANSTSARYADLINIEAGMNLNFHANRGVAGIDGCTSTAVGDAIMANKGEIITLITGDIAFMYDINGLSSISEIPGNLRIIVINNSGGGIFRWLEGPTEVGLIESHFAAKPKSSIKRAASFCGLTYFCAIDIESTRKSMINLFENSEPAILEIITDPEISAEVYLDYLQTFTELHLT